MSNDLFFTSDTHFNHKNVIEYCARPWATVPEMNEGLIANWNAVVPPGGKVFVLGDFCFGNKSAEFLSRLNGTKILVRGNHDATAAKMIAAGFKDVLENEIVKLPDGSKVLVSHFPRYPDQVRVDLGLASEDRRYPYKRIYGCAELWLLHGHVHQEYMQRGMQINVGVDVHGWKPLHWTEIKKIMENAK